MFKRLARKPRGRIVAVADIGSASGGVCILATSGDGPSQILAAERCALSYEERTLEATIAGISAKLAEAAQKAMASLTSKGSVRVSNVYVVVRGPWTHSKAIRVSSQFPEEQRIEGSMIAELAQQALGKETEFDHANIMEASIMRLELNGYPTANPEGKLAHSLSVAVLLSDLDPRVRAAISEALSKVFALPDLMMRSGLRALISTLRESSALPKECVLIDMTSEATHIVAIRKGVPAETAVVPEGKRSILKRVAADKMPEEILGLIRMLESDKCDPATCETIKSSLAKAEPDLARGFGETMSKLAAARRLPNSLIITAHEDILPWMSRFFSRIDFAQFTTTLRPFEPRVLTSQHFSELVTPSPGVSVDLGLLLASALVNIEERV